MVNRCYESLPAGKRGGNKEKEVLVVLPSLLFLSPSLLNGWLSSEAEGSWLSFRAMHHSTTTVDMATVICSPSQTKQRHHWCLGQGQ